jgi:diadenosine tetraphosphate (Ap4A) HIT family hydrolase
MSLLWTDHDKWLRLCKKDNCPVCVESAPPSDLVTISETDFCWLEAHPRVALRGTCYVMPKRHAVELFDLSEEDAVALVKYLMRVSRALKEVTGAAKINMEVHGNTVPHLHVHLFPRYVEGDRFGDGPIDPRMVQPPAYQEGEFEGFVGKMRSALETPE